MISYEASLAIIGEVTWEVGSELLALTEAGGRVAAETIAMARDQPPFDRATMDGVALYPLPDQDRYPLIGTIHAGADSALRPAAGEALRIMTGARVPPHCTVVPSEDCRLSDESVVVDNPQLRAAGRNIAWQGEDAAAGTAIITPGQRLSPLLLAAAAMAGAETLRVYRRPSVSILTTGDEVGAEHDSGIVDSNGPLLVAACGQLGLPLQRRQAPDRLEALSAFFAEDQAQLLLTSGGVSMGERDLVPAALAAAGFVQRFHKVAIQPGKPVLFAEHPDGRKALALPGNPLAVVACFHLFVLPLLGRAWTGFSHSWCQLPAASDGAHHKPRRLFRPARLGPRGVEALPWNGSGDLLAAACGDGLIDLQPGASWAAGDALAFLPYLGASIGAGLTLPRVTDA